MMKIAFRYSQQRR